MEETEALRRHAHCESDVGILNVFEWQHLYRILKSYFSSARGKRYIKAN